MKSVLPLVPPTRQVLVRGWYYLMSLQGITLVLLSRCHYNKVGIPLGHTSLFASLILRPESTYRGSTLMIPTQHWFQLSTIIACSYTADLASCHEITPLSSSIEFSFINFIDFKYYMKHDTTMCTY
jgi:hypothetical protein